MRRHRYSIILLLDAALVSLAFYLGYLLRFEGHVPAEWVAQFARYLPLLVLVRISLNLAFGIHRWAFRLSGFHEANRLLLATLAGTGCFVVICYFMQRAAVDVSLGPPRSVIVIEFFLTASFLGFFRFSPRLAHGWSLERNRSRSGSLVRAVIVGAGSAGELLLRDLNRSNEHSYDVVGFVDDDRAKWRTSIGGRPVLGSLEDLPDIVRHRSVSELLFAIPRLPAGRLREVLDRCAHLKLGYKIIPVSYAYLNDRVGASMLQALEPDDLLPRHEVSFDEGEIRALVNGRRILVTGAAGSIGSEICRQAAAGAPKALVLVDQNENDLYFLYRHLARSHPDVEVFAEVADVRDRSRILALGREYRPQDVFHTAAHKHVPLMEHAPEEAVKTNVIGCLNVATMAEAVGAERFVLISTDKAVNPASVMGATKAVAERIVRSFARRSPTFFTTVRFGNVLGSAGSVVPLFKAQIARGGPVTVTDPGCRRYLMTIREAVGLVMLAGLGRHGDLCILEMGEPIRILDLARMMITMSGFVPEEEIAIEVIGLRPGEKLEEQLMTAEEQRHASNLGDVIRVVRTAAPPADLLERVGRLHAIADSGDQEAVRAALRGLVPTYNAAGPPARSELVFARR